MIYLAYFKFSLELTDGSEVSLDSAFAAAGRLTDWYRKWSGLTALPLTPSSEYLSCVCFIPFKLLFFENGVNNTFGLPLFRTKNKSNTSK